MGYGTSLNQMTPKVIPNLGNITQLSFTGFHSLFVTDQFRVMSMGLNSNGQLGLGDTSPRIIPTIISTFASGDSILQVATGMYFSMFLLTNNTLYTCGMNKFGQLGVGDYNDRSTPTRIIGGIQDVIYIAAGWNHACMIATNSALYCSGNNQFGQLGIGNSVDQSSFVYSLGSAFRVSASQWHTCVRNPSNQLYCYGLGDVGQLGQGSTGNIDSASTGLVVSTGVFAIAVGPQHSIYATNLEIWAVGGNSRGELGSGDNIGTLSWKSVRTISGVPLQITTGPSGNTFVLQTADEVYSCGSNFNGNLGHGDLKPKNTFQRLNLNGIKLIAAGTRGTMFLHNNATVLQVGFNTFGALGTESKFDLTIPTTHPILKRVIGFAKTRVDSNFYFVNGTSNGTLVYATGSNRFGQLCLGNNAETSELNLLQFANISSISSGPFHSIIHTKDGFQEFIWSCGYNQYGSLGLGHPFNRNYPEQVNLNNVVASSVGTLHSLALLSNGDVYGWGRNDVGQVGIGSTSDVGTPAKLNALSNIKYIAAGASHSVAVKTDDTVYVWGTNANGQLGLGALTGSTSPTLNGALSLGVVDFVAAGGDRTYLSYQNSYIMTCGVNSNGQLGVNHTNLVKIPERMMFNSSRTFVKKLSVGVTTTYLLMNDSTVYMVGSSLSSELGFLDFSIPRIVPSLVGVDDISAGNHLVALYRIRCNNVTSTDPSVCSGHGTCEALDVCSCSPGWIGNNCQILECFGIKSTNSSVCSGRGTCQDPGICTNCTSAYGGSQCELPICFGVVASSLLVCSGQGKCISPNNCTCDGPEFTGIQCQRNIFVWKNQSGLWDIVSNWYSQTPNGGLVNATRLPTLGDSIMIMLPGNYTITVTGKSLNLTNLYVLTRYLSNITLLVVNSTIIVSSDFELDIFAKLDVTNSTILINGNNKFTGNILLRGYCRLVIQHDCVFNSSLTYQMTDLFTFASNVHFRASSVVSSSIFEFLGKSVVFSGSSRLVVDRSLSQNSTFSWREASQLLVQVNATFQQGITSETSITIESGAVLTLGGISIMYSHVFGNGQLNMQQNAQLKFAGMNQTIQVDLFASYATLDVQNFVSINTSNMNTMTFIGSGTLEVDGPQFWVGSCICSPKLMIRNTLVFTAGDHSLQAIDSTFPLEIQSLATVTVNSNSIFALGNINSKFIGSGNLIVASGSFITMNSLEFTFDLNLQAYGSIDFISNTVTFKDILVSNTGQIKLSNGAKAIVTGIMQLDSPTKPLYNVFNTLENRFTLNIVPFAQLIWNSGEFSNPLVTFLIFGRLIVKNNAKVTFGTISLRGDDASIYGSFAVASSFQYFSGTLQNGVIRSLGSSRIDFSPPFLSQSKNILSTSFYLNDQSLMTIVSSMKWIQSNLTISTGSTLIISPTASLFGEIQSSESTIYNFGTIISNTTVPINIDIQIVNAGSFEIQGNGISRLNTLFTQTSNGRISISKNATLLVQPTLLIASGSLNLNGTIESGNFTISSRSGMILLQERANIRGNASFLEGTTLMMKTSRRSGDILSVQGNFILKSLFLIKIMKPYSPSVGDMLSFFNFDSGSFDPLVHIVGTTQRSGRMLSDGNVEVIYSYGSADTTGYRCHYLGKSKILEINVFSLQNQVSLAFTVPIVESGWFGIGFNSNTSLEGFIQSEKQVFRTISHNQSISRNFAGVTDVFYSEGPSIFNLGVTYQTINLVVSKSDLEDQQRVFYVYGSSANVTTMTFSPHSILETSNFNILTGQEVECSNFLQPARWEVYEPAALGTILGIYLILFAICLIFWKHQPLFSRGISPHLTLFFLFAQLLMEIRNYFVIPEFQGSLCFYYAFGYYPLQLICFFVIWIYFLRYFSIINMNENKMNIFNANADRFMEWKIHVLKLTSSTWFTIIILTITYVFVVFAFFIVLIFNTFECRFENMTGIKTLHNVFLIIIYFLTLLSFAIDLIGNYKLILHFQWKKYILNDPYYFRVQIIIYIPFMIYSLIVEIVSLFTTLKYIDIIKNYQVTMSFNTISASILIIIDVLFPLTITIFRLVRNLGRKPKGDLLEAVLNDQELLILFTDFCQREYAIENLAAHLDIQEFKKSKSDPLKIYFKYLNGANSPMEINIGRSTCSRVFEKLKNNDIKSDLFDEVETAVIQNLSDTFSRFCFSSGYEKVMSKKKIQHELLEK